MKLYDAARCPYSARVRLQLAEKGIDHEVVAIDLNARPPWLYELNPSGRVPVLDDGFVLAESPVIMEYLEEVAPDRPLLPASPRDRAVSRLAVERFDELLGDDYYAFRRGEANQLGRRLEALPVGLSLFADFAYVPWVMRLRELYGFVLPSHLDAWVDALSARPSVAAERQILRGLRA